MTPHGWRRSFLINGRLTGGYYSGVACFFTVVGVVAGIGLTAADGLAVAVTGDFIAASFTPALGEAAVRVVWAGGTVPLAALEGVTRQLQWKWLP